MLFSVLMSLAAAEVPEGVRPSVAPINMQVQVDAWRAAGDRVAGTLVCEPLWPDAALLCYRNRVGDEVQWVTDTDLIRWKETPESLKAEMVRRSAPFATSQLHTTSVSNMSAQYTFASNADGWGAAVLLHPDAVVAQSGGLLTLFAAPSYGVVLVWKGGNPELDKVMAVGVKEIYEQRSGSVSAVIHRWTGDEWRPYGEAVPRPESSQAPNK